MNKGHDKGHKGQMSDREAMKLALEALKVANEIDTFGIGKKYYRKSITALLTALEQPEQEPVAWMSDSPTKGNGKQLHWTKAEAWRWSSNITPIYTAPPKREWVGLTSEEITKLKHLMDHKSQWSYIEFADAIEAKLKEKNRG